MGMPSARPTLGAADLADGLVVAESNERMASVRCVEKVGNRGGGGVSSGGRAPSRVTTTSRRNAALDGQRPRHDAHRSITLGPLLTLGLRWCSRAATVANCDWERATTGQAARG